MAVTRKRIEKNLQAIRQNIVDACDRVGRNPEDISIIAVTKSVELDTIKNLLDAGITELGENRVQQLTQRAEEVEAYIQRRRNALPRPIQWHMIGHLQRNKVKPVLNTGAVIHTIDSLRLAEEISERAAKMNITADVMLQVNCSQEDQKYGVAVGAALHLADMIATMSNLQLVGLMTMGPLVADPEDARNSFVRLRELFAEMKKENIGGKAFKHLSMGMSNDYQIAVEEGATLLRIGSALFATD